jgi:MYXO-CTERM domain-containing protein
MRPALVALLTVCAVFSASSAARARAEDDCPPGSVYRTQDGYSFCEPTVCDNDGQCNPATEVCRPIALCMQVGTLDPKKTTLQGDAGQRLVVTQRCAPDKTCPQTTVCSDKGRCVSKAVAEKMGILTVSSATQSQKPASGSEKRSCGCRVVGGGNGDTTAGFLASAGVAAIAIGRRRRRG